MSQIIGQLIQLFEQLDVWDTQGRRSVNPDSASETLPGFEDSNTETPLSRTINQYRQLTTQIREIADNNQNEDLLRHLTGWLQHKSKIIRLNAVEALGYTRNTAAISALVNVIYSDPDDGVRAAAAQSLGIIGSELATPALARVLQSDILHAGDVKVHWASAQALSFIADPNAVDILKETLTKSYEKFEEQASEIREAARDALVSIGGDLVVNKLIALWGKHAIHPVEDIDLLIRCEMVVAFSQLENPMGVDFLLTLAHHEHPFVRESVISVLPNLRDARVVPILTEALNDSDSYVRDAAAYSLERMGKSM